MIYKYRNKFVNLKPNHMTVFVLLVLSAEILNMSTHLNIFIAKTTTQVFY